MFPRNPSLRAVLKKVQEEMALRLKRSGAPEDLHAFLMQGWSRVLAGIYLEKGNQHDDWLSAWETVQALLWSLSPKRGREETTMLLRMLPSLLARLHAGCTAMNMALSDRDVLFERLAMLHAAVAREGLSLAAGDEGPITRLQDETAAADSGSDLHGLAAPDLPPTDPQDTVLQLKQGARVAFLNAAGERQLILTWVSPGGGMYLFADEFGLDPVTLTRARLEAFIRSGAARLAG